jgi:hypothetical protein
MMTRIFTILLAFVATLCVATVTLAQSTSAHIDQTTSYAVTKYLHAHKLPMVGAQVSNTPSGRHLMLYGFVATDFGKHDAETKSKAYLNDSSIVIANNIRVNPQIRNLNKRPPPAEGDAASAYGPSLPPPKEADWERTVDDTLHEGGAVPSNDPNLKMPPPGPGPLPPGSSW